MGVNVSVLSLENPLTQAVILKGIQYISMLYLKKTSGAQIDPSSAMIAKINETLERLERERNIAPAQTAQVSVQTSQTSPSPGPDQKKVIKFFVEEPKQQNMSSVATACLPCTRAHLITIAGTLKEALRFARDEGINHKEVLDRLDAAAEEIAVMERFDLSPEKVDNAPEHEKKVIREVILPKIRTIRQNLINNVQKVEDLEEIAVSAVELYKQARSQTIDPQKEEINPGNVTGGVENKTRKLAK